MELHQVGITEDRKMVIKVPAELYFQKGLPLCFIFDFFIKSDFVPSWRHLLLDLMKGGMSYDGAIRCISENCFDSYGKEYRDVIIDRLNKLWNEL